MKNLLAILLLVALFSCQETIEPEITPEEVASSALEVKEVPETELEIVIECFEEVFIEEIVFEENEIPTEQEIEEEILVDLDVEVKEIEIVEALKEIRQN